MHGSPNLDDVNDAFLASLIDYKPNSKLSPYKKIKKLPRATFLSIKNNKEFKTYSYDPFSVSLNIKNKVNGIIHRDVNNLFLNSLIIKYFQIIDSI